MAFVRPDLALLMGALAHDLKNPLAGVTTNLEYVEGGGEGAMVAEAIGDAMVAAEQIQGLLRNLELLARAPTTEARMNLFDLGAAVDTAVGRTLRGAAAVGLVFERAVEGEARAWGSADLMVRAVENCIANVIEHVTRSATVAISISTAGRVVRLSIEATRTRSWALFESDEAATDRLSATYGRGMTLLCADVAANAAGARLELGRDGDRARMTLLAPSRRPTGV